jgi:hypothetical protein
VGRVSRPLTAAPCSSREARPSLTPFRACGRFPGDALRRSPGFPQSDERPAPRLDAATAARSQRRVRVAGSGLRVWEAAEQKTGLRVCPARSLGKK